MNPYTPYLLACLNITEETKDRFPLGDVQDVQAVDEEGKLRVLVLTKDDPKVDGALGAHRSFLERRSPETAPGLVVYVFGVPQEHRQQVQEWMNCPDYPQGG